MVLECRKVIVTVAPKAAQDLRQDQQRAYLAEATGRA
jgi:hypothetical protein